MIHLHCVTSRLEVLAIFLPLLLVEADPERAAVVLSLGVLDAARDLENIHLLFYTLYNFLANSKNLH